MRDLMRCGECRWYRENECWFGGGFHHYPNPEDECVLGKERDGVFNRMERDE